METQSKMISDVRIAPGWCVRGAYLGADGQHYVVITPTDGESADTAGLLVEEFETQHINPPAVRAE